MKKSYFLTALSLSLISFAAAQKVPTLTSVPVTSAPTIDGIASEPYWKTAPTMTIKTEEAEAPGVANKGITTVTMKSVYTADSVYFLATWRDATYNIDRSRWVFDGKTWSKESAEKFGEDKIAFMWSINAPIFEQEGTWSVYKNQAEAQAAGYTRPVKAAPTGEVLDMWHYKMLRTGFSTPRQIDDQYVDDTFDAAKNAGAGRRNDEGSAGYYNNERDFKLPDGKTIKVPRYAFKDGNADALLLTQNMIDSGLTYELTDAQVMALPAGTHLPSVVGRAFNGSRGDITAQFSWRDGLYILEFGRKLKTGDMAHDVTFSDLAKTYFFGLATFDNTEARHAVTDLIQFKFRK